MKKDIDINPFSDWYSTFKTTFLWIGGYGSMTGMHNDDENNVLCQIYGNKTVYLYPPSAREYLYVNSMYDSGTECCDVDALNSIEDNQIKYPKFMVIPSKISAVIMTASTCELREMQSHRTHRIKPAITVKKLV